MNVNFEAMREEIRKILNSIDERDMTMDSAIDKLLNLHSVSHSFTKEDMWDAWWASAIKTISFSGVDKDYERRCFEKFYKNKMDSNCR